ncbi:MAG: hypothetical protein Q9214_002887 [Letrouitia sp. 1 TL-2023]
MALSLGGKTAIVTGAGSGINLAFARLLLERGCNVLIADLALRPEADDVIACHSHKSHTAARAIFQQTDVREWSQLERMFRTATEEFGRVDVVCPGAGVYEPLFSSFWHPPGIDPSLDSATSSRYAILDINLTHPIRTTQLAMAYFLAETPSSPSNSSAARGPKHIIHISSIAAQVTPFLAPLYNATKHGLSGFVRSLAPLDRKLGIRVTAVAPGVIDTPLWRDNPEKLRLVNESKGDEWVSAEFVAETMVRLLEEEEVEVEDPEADVTDLLSDIRKDGRKTVKVEGGLILEVSKDRVRKVEQFGDRGPKGKGNTVGNAKLAEEEIVQKLGAGEWGKFT